MLRDRHRRSVAALAVATLLVVATTRARASVGPGCDGGAPCADADGDGFLACACAPAGTACDCDDTDPLSFPGAPEACDMTKDRDCNSRAGTECGVKKGCLRGVCVPECIPLDDFGCAPFAHCEGQPNDQRLCAGSDCSVYGCAPGSTCDDDKRCISNCNPGVRCPVGQRCRGFGCVDPCEGIVCPMGGACENGRCIGSCDCSPASTGCPPGKDCDRSSAVARCVDPGCAGVACPSGAHCAAGKCVGDCAGVVCPPKRVCRPGAVDGGTMHGACVDLCSPDRCTVPFVCDWRTGACVPAAFRDGGLAPVGSSMPLDEDLVVGGAGFTCTASGMVRASATGAVLAVLGLAAVLARRAHRRRR